MNEGTGRADIHKSTVFVIFTVAGGYFPVLTETSRQTIPYDASCVSDRCILSNDNHIRVGVYETGKHTRLFV